MKVYTVSDCVRIIGVSKATIRNYSTDYKPHFSSGANPSIGGTRKYNLDDMRTLAYIKYMRGNGSRRAEILESLPQGLNDFEWSLPQKEKTLEDVEGQIIPNSTLAVWEAEMQKRDEQIEELTDENKSLLREVGRLEGENKVLRENRKGFWASLFGRKY